MNSLDPYSMSCSAVLLLLLLCGCLVHMQFRTCLCCCLWQIGTVRDPELRVQIVSERSTFDEDPAAFHKVYADKQVGLFSCACVLGCMGCLFC